MMLLGLVCLVVFCLPTFAQAAAAKGASMADIGKKLNNPGSDLAQLNFKFIWDQYKGDLPGTTSQDSVTLEFQPVFPFKLNDEYNLIVRPTIPLTWTPHFNASAGGFDEQFGLGDTQLMLTLSHTNAKKGYFWGVGMTPQFPTHTDDVLGNDAFQLGPAAYYGIGRKWGTLGVFPQHWWNIGGGDGYSCLTATQIFYWFDVGKEGWQIGGSPVISYNWAADDSDQAWTIPVNLGLAKTVKIGETPVKFKLEGVYYFDQPDAFGPSWGLQFTCTPVIANPFEAHSAKK